MLRVVQVDFQSDPLLAIDNKPYVPMFLSKVVDFSHYDSMLEWQREDLFQVFILSTLGDKQYMTSV